MRKLIQLLLASLSIQFLGCTDNEGVSSDPIAQALSELKKRTNDDSFVIIEALPTQNYVQFATYTDQSIFVDFPISRYDLTENAFVGIIETNEVNEISNTDGYTLSRFISAEEEERLQDYLKEWNVVFKLNEEKGTASNGETVNFFTSIEGSFEIKSKKQSDFVHGIFTEVFRLKDYNINIEEN
ncbi:MAG: hypothetical protein AAF065_15005 [Verrucomicrobiota bacterium]